MRPVHTHISLCTSWLKYTDANTVPTPKPTIKDVIDHFDVLAFFASLIFFWYGEGKGFALFSRSPDYCLSNSACLGIFGLVRNDAALLWQPRSDPQVRRAIIARIWLPFDVRAHGKAGCDVAATGWYKQLQQILLLFSSSSSCLLVLVAFSLLFFFFLFCINLFFLIILISKYCPLWPATYLQTTKYETRNWELSDITFSLLELFAPPIETKWWTEMRILSNSGLAWGSITRLYWEEKTRKLPLLCCVLYWYALVVIIEMMRKCGDSYYVSMWAPSSLCEIFFKVLLFRIPSII